MVWQWVRPPAAGSHWPLSQQWWEEELKWEQNNPPLKVFVCERKNGFVRVICNVSHSFKFLHACMLFESSCRSVENSIQFLIGRFWNDSEHGKNNNTGVKAVLMSDHEFLPFLQLSYSCHFGKRKVISSHPSSHAPSLPVTHHYECWSCKSCSSLFSQDFVLWVAEMRRKVKVLVRFGHLGFQPMSVYCSASECMNAVWKSPNMFYNAHILTVWLTLIMLFETVSTVS